MKKITILIIVFLLPYFLFANYSDFIAKGNAAYKSKNWLYAAQWYKKAYQEQPNEQLKKFMNVAIQNAYKESLLKGNTAYKSDNMQEALKWYTQAEELSPNKQLENFILKLGGGLKIQPEFDTQKKDDKNSFFKWVLMGGDVLLLSGSILTYLDSSKSVDDYNAKYDQTNNTTMDNYNLLVEKRTSTQGKQATFGIFTGLFATAATYTIIDALFLHITFPKETAMKVEYEENQIKLVCNKVF